jgi:hypothetical protein
MRALMLCSTLALLTACSTQNAYVAVQEAGRQQCMQQPPSEQSRCLERLNKDDYDTWQKRRGE